jgi:hypothetical protein
MMPPGKRALYQQRVQSYEFEGLDWHKSWLSPLEPDGDHGKDHSAEAILDGVRFPVLKIPKRARLPWQRGHCVKSETE